MHFTPQGLAVSLFSIRRAYPLGQHRAHGLLCWFAGKTDPSAQKPFYGLNIGGSVMRLRISALLHWLKGEPFVHFVALGALIFIAAYAMDMGANGQNTPITVTVQDLERLRAQSLQQWGREPAAPELQTLVQDFVREEVLVREARAQGLDQDDQIVRRRLAQKMEFLANQTVEPPTAAELRTYYARHAERYAQPPVVDLEQYLFRTDLRGDGAVTAARAALRNLQTGQPVLGDASMLPAQALGQDEMQVAREFGAEFAKAAWAAPTGVWIGPVVSPFGLHLVRVNLRKQGVVATLDAVRDRVSADLLNERIAAAREQNFAVLRKKYAVQWPASVTQASPQAPTAGVQVSTTGPLGVQP